MAPAGGGGVGLEVERYNIMLWGKEHRQEEVEI